MNTLKKNAALVSLVKLSLPSIQKKLTTEEICRFVSVVSEKCKCDRLVSSDQLDADVEDLCGTFERRFEDRHVSQMSLRDTAILHNDSGTSDFYQIYRKDVLLVPYKRNDNPVGGYHGISMGVYDSSHQIINDMMLIRGRKVALPIDFDGASNFLDGEFIYGGCLFNNFGHFLLESLARVHHVKRLKLPFIWLGNKHIRGLRSWQSEILDVLGVDRSKIEILTVPTRVASVVDVEPGFELRNYFHRELGFSLGVFDLKVNSAKKRVWLSRSTISAPLSKIDGEIQVEEILESKGWYIFHPQSHSVPQQLRVLSGAELIAGFEGSAFHLLIMLRQPKAKVVIFVRGDASVHGDRAETHLNSNFYIIQQLLGFRQLVFKVDLDYLSGNERRASYRLRRPSQVVDILDSIVD